MDLSIEQGFEPLIIINYTRKFMGQTHVLFLGNQGFAHRCMMACKTINSSPKPHLNNENIKLKGIHHLLEPLEPLLILLPSYLSSLSCAVRSSAISSEPSSSSAYFYLS